MIIGRRNKDYIHTKYTHWGLLLGCVPIWLKLIGVEDPVTGDTIVMIEDRDDESEFPAMEEINWIPKVLFYIAAGLYGAWLYSGLSVRWDVPAPVLVLGVLDNAE